MSKETSSITKPATKDTTYPPLPDAAITAEAYKRLYAQSINDPDGFWGKVAGDLTWIKKFTRINESSFDPDNFRVRWFADGALNVCANCIDIHLETKRDKTAIIWEGDKPDTQKHITYGELYAQVCKLANLLKQRGVKKGDRVVLYMPMIPEAAFAMLACARIGAVHSVVFGGFSPESLATRIDDCEASCIITAEEGVRGGKTTPLKRNVLQALDKAACANAVHSILVFGTKESASDPREVDAHAAMQKAKADCPAEVMNAEDPLFILYTSGSTGKPKGALHTSGGYLTYVRYSFACAFDLREDDVYWCTADVGWITGHSYIVYGPLANGATTLMFAGVPTYPDAGRFWQVIDKHAVSIFYTAPTALRSLMRQGDAHVLRSSRRSLRVLGSVGEPINPAAWQWYYEVVGEKRCPVIDSWWQTETGGMMITPLAGATPTKPGSASWPFFGIQPAIVDDGGDVLDGAASGQLVILHSWPGQMRSIYGDHQRYIDTYFKVHKGKYFTGDGARRDADGYYWITGRIDDVINVSGHLLSTAEVENALVGHEKIAEAAVVGCPHDIKGQGVYCYVALLDKQADLTDLNKELIAAVRQKLGPIAKPDIIQIVPEFPKTRSGKIMRRILRKIAENAFDSLGDVSTLADPSVVDVLISQRKQIKI